MKALVVLMTLSLAALVAFGFRAGVGHRQEGSDASPGPGASPTVRSTPADPRASAPCAHSWIGGELEPQALAEAGVTLRNGVVQNLTAVVGEEPLARFEGDPERGPVVNLSWKLSASDVLCVQVLKKSAVTADAAASEVDLFDDGEKLNLATETSYTDHGPFDTGRSCYRIVPISERGPLEFAETCVDVPMARGGFVPVEGGGSPNPAGQPSALPTLGGGGSSGGGFPWWALGLAIVPLAALVGYALVRRRGV